MVTLLTAQSLSVCRAEQNHNSQATKHTASLCSENVNSWAEIQTQSHHNCGEAEALYIICQYMSIKQTKLRSDLL